MNLTSKINQVEQGLVQAKAVKELEESNKQQKQAKNDRIDEEISQEYMKSGVPDLTTSLLKASEKNFRVQNSPVGRYSDLYKQRVAQHLQNQLQLQQNAQQDFRDRMERLYQGVNVDEDVGYSIDYDKFKKVPSNNYKQIVADKLREVK